MARCGKCLLRLSRADKNRRDILLISPRFRPKEGQNLHVRPSPDNDHTDLIDYAPGKWPGGVLHDSEAIGIYEYSCTVTRTGAHPVSVFQTQDAIADNLTGRYQLLIDLTNWR